MSDEFMHEVHEDLRQQQLKEFWRENGNWIIGGALLAVVMTAGMALTASGVIWRAFTVSAFRSTKESRKNCTRIWRN